MATYMTAEGFNRNQLGIEWSNPVSAREIYQFAETYAEAYADYALRQRTPCDELPPIECYGERAEVKLPDRVRWMFPHYNDEEHK